MIQFIKIVKIWLGSFRRTYEMKKQGVETPEDIKYREIGEKKAAADRADSAFYELKELKKQPRDMWTEEDRAHFENITQMAKQSNLWVGKK